MDAAERVLLRSPTLIANMADVAQEAGLAKGTVYLYFPSKEELLLALHERNIDGFFHALIALLDRDTAVGIEDVFALSRTHIVAPPLFLPLASRCFGVMDQTLPVGVGRAFRQRMAERLERAGAGLERHFAMLKAGDGVTILRHTYALILGLWQIAGDDAGGPGALRRATSIARHLPRVTRTNSSARYSRYGRERSRWRRAATRGTDVPDASTRLIR